VGRQPIPPSDTPAFVAADVNADGVVDATDVDLMISRYLGKIDRFPVEP
jgi:Dockerin type I domain